LDYKLARKHVILGGSKPVQMKNELLQVWSSSRENTWMVNHAGKVRISQLHLPNEGCVVEACHQNLA